MQGDNKSGQQIFWGRQLNRFRYIGTKAAGVLILGMFVLTSALVVATGPEAAPVERAEREWPVAASVVQPAAMSPTLQAYGRLESDQQATLRAGLTADVSAVHFREGDWVNAGDVLLELDPREAELALRAAQAAERRAEASLKSVVSDYELAQTLATHHEDQLRIAREKLQRFESLHTQRMIADAQLDEVRHEATERAMVHASHQATLADYPNQIAQAEAALEESRASLARAELDLRHTQVAAPFNGRILSLGVAVGDRISVGSELLQVADYDRLQVRASLPIEMAAQLRGSLQSGQVVTATINDATSASEQSAQVLELKGLAGNVKSGQSGIDGFFKVPADATLALGAVVNLNVRLPLERDVVAVPMHAIYDNDRIYRIDHSRLEAVQVERVGEHIDQQGNYHVLVRSQSLTAGDQIMVSQLPTAMTGLLVNPVTESALAESAPLQPGVAAVSSIN
ncbi:MAG TPA: hypothetical protein DD407_11725 [Pseudohongiella sp.]|nr:hypothetical protein [Gammaproteobacteria bacterium]HBN15697.1 hypothetical protein [Pseudohongiella sp.]|tara:strand:+ start:61 stop:1431 length:1371 start_codon:yes stop_codon:yes gene_type:complete